jgi:hypothetical protein
MQIINCNFNNKHNNNLVHISLLKINDKISFTYISVIV